MPSRRRPDAVAASGRRAFPASSRVWSHCRSSCPVRGTAARPCALRRGRPRPPRSRPPPPRSRRTTPSSCAGRRAAAASPVPGSVSRWTTRDRPPWVRWSSTPRTAAERADVDRAVTRVVAGCRARSARLLPHVGTLDVARDLDIPRAALGDTTLTYLSASPTALYVGAKYAESSLGGYRPPYSTARSTWRSTRRRSTPPGGRVHSGAAQLSAVLRCRADLWNLARRRERPVRRAASPDHGCAATGPGRAGRLTSGAALYGFAAGLNGSRDSWTRSVFALEEAEAGDGSALLRPYDDIAGRNAHGSYTNELEASDAVNCLDRPAADGHARSSAGARRPAHVGDRDHPRSSHPVHLGRQARPAAARCAADLRRRRAHRAPTQRVHNKAVDAHLIDLRLPPGTAAPEQAGRLPKVRLWAAPP